MIRFLRDIWDFLNATYDDRTLSFVPRQKKEKP